MNRDFLDRGKEFTSMLESSRYMCGKNGVDPHCTKLPEVTEEDVERCKKLVSGHIRLMRRSTPEYYKAVQDVLSENKAVLLYTYINFDIFGRYGNQKLKDELAAKNIRLGATLSEKNAGTNAAVMASRSPKSVWVVGNEHYMDALKPYACYAFRINGKYGRSGYIVLMTYRDNLDERIVKLFRLIESTECIITAGLVAKDVIMRDAMQRNEYSKSSTSDIVIMVDNSSTITFANDMFYEFYNHAPLETINSSLGSICPELEPLVPLISQGKRVMGRQVELVRPSMETEQYFVDMSPINTNSKRLGMLITLYKGKAKAASAAAGGNAARYTFGDLIGVSEPFVQLKRFAEEIAATPSPILIQGESGTGKELFANAIHCASQRRDKPFVAINCAAIPRDLIGSELFGYVGGSFTGASRTGAKGKFELADGGTLFLDEIGEMPVEMQSVLLRALEENTITRIGATKPINVDVRIITATNKDLPKCISEGSFKADLYYRLSVINLNMVPLRQRREDIPVLADYFLKHFAASNNKPMKGISTEAMTAMMEYAWPGNVRELRNAVERGVIVSKNGYIEAEDMPEVITGRIKPQPEPEQPRERVRDLESFFERQRLDMAKKLMVEFKGNKSKVAQKMGISRSTLYRLLNRAGEV